MTITSTAGGRWKACWGRTCWGFWHRLKGACSDLQEASKEWKKTTLKTAPQLTPSLHPFTQVDKISALISGSEYLYFLPPEAPPSQVLHLCLIWEVFSCHTTLAQLSTSKGSGMLYQHTSVILSYQTLSQNNPSQFTITILLDIQPPQSSLSLRWTLVVMHGGVQQKFQYLRLRWKNQEFEVILGYIVNFSLA